MEADGVAVLVDPGAIFATGLVLGISAKTAAPINAKTTATGTSRRGKVSHSFQPPTDATLALVGGAPLLPAAAGEAGFSEGIAVGVALADTGEGTGLDGGGGSAPCAGEVGGAWEELATVFAGAGGGGGGEGTGVFFSRSKIGLVKTGWSAI